MIEGKNGSLRLVELFAGCGGLAIGLERAGFSHDLLVEWNKDAAETVEHNIRMDSAAVRGWNYVCSDVRAMKWRERPGHVDMVAGGPPCQPFSTGGKATGHLDPRDMWPEAVRAVREMRPEAFLFENVRGLLRPIFSDYVDLIMATLRRPGIERLDDELPLCFSRRLETLPAEYDVRFFSVNAADYGAAQKRHRVFFAGLRCDLGIVPRLPAATHSEDRLLWDKWVTGSYWERHAKTRPDLPSDCKLAKAVARLEATGRVPSLAPWRTCRDAFAGLGEPSDASLHANHRFQAGAIQQQ